MQAKIDVREHLYDAVETRTRITFFGRIKYDEKPLGKRSSYIVDLSLTPSEEERAIILKYKLDELVLENEFAFDEEALAREYNNLHPVYMKEFKAFGNPDRAREAEEAVQEHLKTYRQTRKLTKLSEYFDNPYSRSFDNSHDAHTYAHKLRNEILPAIKKFIEDYKNNPVGNTFTV